MFVDIDKLTGMNITGFAHLQQSIGDILTSPRASRLMRRRYGSTLFELVSQAHNAAGRLRLYAAVVTALYIWEPRVMLDRVLVVDANMQGRVVLQLEGEVAIDGQVYELGGMKIHV